MKPTFTINDWKLEEIETPSFWLTSYIPERWGDKFVHTSRLISIDFEEMKAETLNSFYKLTLMRKEDVILPSKYQTDLEVLQTALKWITNVVCGVSKSGGEVSSDEGDAAIENAQEVLIRCEEN